MRNRFKINNNKEAKKNSNNKHIQSRIKNLKTILNTLKSNRMTKMLQVQRHNILSKTKYLIFLKVSRSVSKADQYHELSQAQKALMISLHLR